MNKTLPTASILIAILFCMSALSGISSDMYIAAFPAIGHYFGVSASLIKWTLSLFFIGLAGSQLIYGPLSDYIGRKKIMTVGFVIFIMGSLLCLSCKEFSVFLLGRFVQGCGVGATVCLSRAILRDVFDGAPLAKALSYIGMGLAIVPAVAPVLGAYIQSLIGWRFEFLFMLFYTLILQIMATLIIPETNAYIKQYKKTIKVIISEYRTILVDPVFFINVLIASFIISVIYIFYSITTFYFQNHYHWNAVEYSRINILLAAALFAGRKINILMTQRMSNNKVILLGSILSLLTAVLMALFSWLNVNPVITLLIPTALYAVSGGIIFSNTFVGATAKYTKIAGSVSSLYGFTQMLTVFVLVSLSSILGLASIVSIYSLLFIFSLLSIIMIRWLIKQTNITV